VLLRGEASTAAANPVQERARVSARPAWPRQWVRARRPGRLTEVPWRSLAARPPAEPWCPARRPASRNGERSAAADAASAPRASRPGASSGHETASRGAWPGADGPPPRAPLRQEHFRARPRSRARTRSALARQPWKPLAEQTPLASERRQAAGLRAGAAEAASTGPRSRVDRRHVACRAGRGEPLPSHLPLRSSRRSRPPRHRPRPRRSPNRAESG
jgi:hypothetical protein